MTSNFSFNYTTNYTVIGTVNDIASLSYYPLIFLTLIIIPAIILIIALSINISNKTKTLILFFNMVYSLLLPIILISIIDYFELKFYIYEIILNNNNITDLFSTFSLSLAGIYHIISWITLLYVIINAIMIYYNWFKEVVDYIIIPFKSLINHIISGIKSCTTSDRNNENKKY
jgi:hypothetical protein